MLTSTSNLHVIPHTFNPGEINEITYKQTKNKPISSINRLDNRSQVILPKQNTVNNPANAKNST